MNIAIKPGEHVPVIIIGAGPNGLLAALALRQRGIKSIVLEAKPGLIRRDSGAITMPRPVLEILQSVAPAVYEKLRRIGLTWTKKTTYFGPFKWHLWTHDYSRHVTGGMPPFINIVQHLTVELLFEEIRQYPDFVTVKFDEAALEICQTAVDATVITAKAVYTTPYVIACDGVHSPTRKRLGIELAGDRSTCKFVILDIIADLPLSSERRYYFSAPGCKAGGGVLLIPEAVDAQGKAGWRIDFQLSPKESAIFDFEAALHNGDIERRLRRIIGNVPYELNWKSVYHFNQKVATTYQAGRVFLAGDAAHAFSPFGAPGLTTGFGDVMLLADLLQGVLVHDAPASTLERYTAERREFALAKQRTSQQVLRAMIPKNTFDRLWRNVRLLLGVVFPGLRAALDSGPYDKRVEKFS
jgi:3-(3-hydroxy-phenyl)propionate hydroxylase